MMHACMQILATFVKLLVHDMIGYICSNYVFIQEHIIQMTALIQHSIYLLQEQESLIHHTNYLLQELECVAHINARSLHLHLLHNWVVTTQDVLTPPVPHL